MIAPANVGTFGGTYQTFQGDDVPESPGATGKLWDRDFLRITEAIGDSFADRAASSPGQPLRLDQNTLGNLQAEINRIDGDLGRRYKAVITTAEAAGAGGILYTITPERKRRRR